MELQHHGVRGMKWGVRRFQNADGSLTSAGRRRYADDPAESRKTRKLVKQANTARESAKEWNEMAKYAEEKGNANKARKYRENAKFDRQDAKEVETGALAKSRKEDKFTATRKDVSASRSLGHKVATNILFGPFANRTYNSVLAGGGTRGGALAATVGASLLGGPLGHLAVSHLLKKDAGEDKLVKRF